MDIIEQQMEFEKKAKEDKENKVRDNNERKVSERREHETKYGSAAVYYVSLAIKEKLETMYDEKRTKDEFFVNHIKPLHEEENKEGPELPIFDWIANTTAMCMVRSISSEPFITNITREVVDNYYFSRGFDRYQMEDDESYKLDEHLMKFFFKIVLSTTSIELSERVFKVVYDDTESKHDRARLVATDEWKENIEKIKNQLVDSAAANIPMVVEPRDHTSLLSGEGGSFVFNTPILKHPIRHKGKVLKEIVDFVDGSCEGATRFFRFFNKKQKIPMCINTEFLSIIKEAHTRGYHLKDFPHNYACIADSVKAKSDKEIRGTEQYQVHLFKAGISDKPELTAGQRDRIRYKNRRTGIGFVNTTNHILSMADKFKGFTIYFNQYADNRGRIYPYVPSSSLSYIGGALSKSLLLLSNKEPLTEIGLDNLYATLGNTLGFDKKSVEFKTKQAREFFDEHKEDFFIGNFDVFFYKYEKEPSPECIAHNNVVDSFDEPIECAAICNELVNYYNDPENYLCGYVNHRDARCSGSSIVGVMMHDRELMRKTSVIDELEGDSLPDLYTYVAHGMVKLCDNDYLNQRRGELCTRKMVKNPTMTYSAYGNGRLSINDDNKRHFIENDLDTEHCQAYTGFMIRSIENETKSCMLYQRAIKRAFNKAIKENDIVFWRSPLNDWPMAFRESKMKRIEVAGMVDKLPKKIYINRPLLEIDKSETVKQGPPGWVHHVDSYLLMRVDEIVDKELITIHDSIGSHPNYSHLVVKGYAQACQELARSDAMAKTFNGITDGVEAPYCGSASSEDIDNIINSKHCLT